jgi:hypothetical protein
VQLMASGPMKKVALGIAVFGVVVAGFYGAHLHLASAETDALLPSRSVDVRSAESRDAARQHHLDTLLKSLHEERTDGRDHFAARLKVYREVARDEAVAR